VFFEPARAGLSEVQKLWVYLTLSSSYTPTHGVCRTNAHSTRDHAAVRPWAPVHTAHTTHRLFATSKQLSPIQRTNAHSTRAHAAVLLRAPVHTTHTSMSHRTLTDRHTVPVFWISTGCGHCNITERGNGIGNSWLDSLNPKWVAHWKPGKFQTFTCP